MPPANSPTETLVPSIDSERVSSAIRRATRLSISNERLREQGISTTTENALSPNDLPSRILQSHITVALEDSLDGSPDLALRPARTAYHDSWASNSFPVPNRSSRTHRVSRRSRNVDLTSNPEWRPLPSSTTTSNRESTTNVPSASEPTTRDYLQTLIRREYLPRAPSPPASPPILPTNNPPPRRYRFHSSTSPSTSQRNMNTTQRNDPPEDLPSPPAIEPQSRATPSVRLPSRTPPLPIEEAIRYLTYIQCAPFELEPEHASIFTKPSLEDLLLDTRFLSIPRTSWLSPGGVFTGSQYAALVNDPNQMHPRHQNRRRSPLSQNRARYQDLPTTTRLEDRWSVKVTIHSIDYDNMKLSGSMHALEVPDKQSATGKSTINTFWEGEIIDFKKHGLETLNFVSTREIDGTYWSKLEPFASISDLDLARKLVSRKFLQELSEQWILMRWKEKCFVPPSSHESGLTISGFYFLCLRRSDGRIEGFYNDPQSSPYQQLSLKPQPRIFPSYEFR